MSNTITSVLKTHEAELLESWITEQTASGVRTNLIRETQLRQESREFLIQFQEATQHQNLTDIYAPEWAEVRQLLSEVSRSRSQLGFTPSETATFIFSLKQPIFNQLRRSMSENAVALVDEIWAVSTLIDKLGLLTTEIYQKMRESVILRQREELSELSTPVVKLWDGILALPIIGTLDSSRTQSIMESLLEKIVETESQIAIIDITGVPTVDTVTAQHLLKTVSAARLMGADCIISGIRPQIAQTIVYLGVDLADVKTKTSLADAFKLALQRLNLDVTRNPG